MASHAWVLGVRPGYEDDYKRRHDELWPEMDACLRAAGYSGAAGSTPRRETASCHAGAERGRFLS